MAIYLYPYSNYSKSARSLARALNIKRILRNGNHVSRYKNIYLNWGSSTPPDFGCTTILNKPEYVATSTNKLKTFEALKAANVSTPDWTTQHETALQWIQEGHQVYSRTILSGHSGSGISVSSVPETLVRAPLYTKRVKAKYEFRVHVWKGRVIDYQQKKRRDGVEANPLIRNHSNGYIFARIGIELPDVVKSTAVAAVAALGLDFGAVDIGYVERDNKAYTYEVNTAPGISNSTVAAYQSAINLEYENV